MPSPKPSGRGVVAVATLCLLLAAVGASLPTAGAQSSAVSVTNATHTPDTPTAGETFVVESVIENHDGAAGDFTINEVYVRKSSGRAYTVDDVGSLSPGSSTAVSLPVSFDDPGWHTFRIVVNGQNANGGIVSIDHPVTVHVVEERQPDVELSVSEGVPGATRPVNVTVANGNRIDLRQVAVTVSSRSANFTLTRRVSARLPAGSDSTFQFPASVAESGTHPVNVTVGYTENGERHRLTRTFRANFDAPPNPGEITLTGVDAVVRGGMIEISATASNVGSTAVDGVVVSVGDAPNVGSADYFVGGVDGSDFSSFTLSTTATGNVSAVPVEVRYVVDGVERSFTTSVPVERAVVERHDSGGDGGGLPTIPIVGAVVVFALLAVGYRWRG